MADTVKISIMKRSSDSRSAYFHREVVRNRVQLQVRVEKNRNGEHCEKEQYYGKTNFFKNGIIIATIGYADYHGSRLYDEPAYGRKRSANRSC